MTQRSKEQELLWRGAQIRQAIESYYKTGHAGMKASFPGSFDDLIRDPRALGVVRHLRKKYLDPMTGEEWQIIRDSKGRLQGVYSSSEDEPFKTNGSAKKIRVLAENHVTRTGNLFICHGRQRNQIKNRKILKLSTLWFLCFERNG